LNYALEFLAQIPHVMPFEVWLRPYLVIPITQMKH